MEPSVLYFVDNEIAVITLNRPDRHNAINGALLSELYDAIDAVSADDRIKVAILTGKGRSFCSGIDLEAVMTENLSDPRGDGSDLLGVMEGCKKPVIGAINGVAITGGFEIALNCDFLIASERAAFADTHARMGIHPGWGMTQLLQEAIGKRRARQMSYSCQFVGAEKALAWGLVNEVVPHEMLLPRAMQIAADICLAHPELLEIMRNLIEFRDTATLERSMAKEREGFDAFVKKHLPK